MLFEEQTFDFQQLTTQQAESTLRENNLTLTVEETLKLQDLLKRPPTLTECILWSIQGSEHCSYKSTRQHLKTLPTDGPNVILGAKEDAGIVRIATDTTGKSYGIVISHESHNHPSQIVPYEGAATGVGGNVRDVSCMGAEVIAVADSLRFGDLSNPRTHWLHQGVVAGIAGYANPLGIPNVGGDLYYDEAYQQNCLVTVVTLGLVAEDHIIHSYAPKNSDGYDLILVGKPTDNSGFGGASFASLELDEEEHEQNRGAVQEPNAFLGRHLLAANTALFKQLQQQELIDQVGFKDLGAGGVACASVEMADAAGMGAEIELTKVHTINDTLHPAVILCSETQERYLWAVPPELSSQILAHYNDTYALPEVSPGARASVIGKIRKGGQYNVYYQGQTTLVDASAEDITRGLQYDRPTQAKTQTLKEPNIKSTNLKQVVLQLLSHENIASRQTVFESYDKQVQGRTIIEAGTADAGIIQPFNSNEYPEEIQATGIALAVDDNPRYGKIDAYWAAVNAVTESMRNVAATGATPQTITDCLCFGNPEKPEQMHDLVEAIRGIRDTLVNVPLKGFTDTPTPVVAGNVSLYNESNGQAIPASPVISCLGKLDDASKAITNHLKCTDSILLMIGERKDECGGSVYYQLFNELGSQLPKPDFNEVTAQIYALTDAIDQELILAAHDISDGGIATCLAEMSFTNEIGFDVTIPGELPIEKRLFSETGGFVLEVVPAQLDAVYVCFERYQLNPIMIGKTQAKKKLSFNGNLSIELNEAKSAWTNGLKGKLL